MAGAPGGRTADNRTADTTAIIERITVALIPKAAADLQRLQEKTGLGKTDVVNRAISLYEFVDEKIREGREVLVRDKATGEIQAVVFF
jgi:hypothetical protein